MATTIVASSGMIRSKNDKKSGSSYSAQPLGRLRLSTRRRKPTDYYGATALNEEDRCPPSATIIKIEGDGNNNDDHDDDGEHSDLELSEPLFTSGSLPAGCRVLVKDGLLSGDRHEATILPRGTDDDTEVWIKWTIAGYSQLVKIGQIRARIIDLFKEEEEDEEECRITPTTTTATTTTTRATATTTTTTAQLPTKHQQRKSETLKVIRRNKRSATPTLQLLNNPDDVCERNIEPRLIPIVNSRIESSATPTMTPVRKRKKAPKMKQEDHPSTRKAKKKKRTEKVTYVANSIVRVDDDDDERSDLELEEPLFLVTDLPENCRVLVKTGLLSGSQQEAVIERHIGCDLVQIKWALAGFSVVVPIGRIRSKLDDDNQRRSSRNRAPPQRFVDLVQKGTVYVPVDKSERMKASSIKKDVLLPVDASRKSTSRSSASYYRDDTSTSNSLFTTDDSVLSFATQEETPLGSSGIKPVTPNVDCVRPTVRSNHAVRNLDFRVIEYPDMGSSASRKSINRTSPLCRAARNKNSDATLTKPCVATDQLGINQNRFTSRNSVRCASISTDSLSDNDGNTSYVSQTSYSEQRKFTSDDIGFIRRMGNTCHSEQRDNNISPVEGCAVRLFSTARKSINRISSSKEGEIDESSITNYVSEASCLAQKVAAYEVETSVIRRYTGARKSINRASSSRESDGDDTSNTKCASEPTGPDQKVATSQVGSIRSSESSYRSTGGSISNSQANDGVIHRYTSARKSINRASFSTESASDDNSNMNYSSEASVQEQKVVTLRVGISQTIDSACHSQGGANINGQLDANVIRRCTSARKSINRQSSSRESDSDDNCNTNYSSEDSGREQEVAISQVAISRSIKSAYHSEGGAIVGGNAIHVRTARKSMNHASSCRDCHSDDNINPNYISETSFPDQIATSMGEIIQKIITSQVTRNTCVANKNKLKGGAFRAYTARKSKYDASSSGDGVCGDNSIQSYSSETSRSKEVVIIRNMENNPPPEDRVEPLDSNFDIESIRMYTARKSINGPLSSRGCTNEGNSGSLSNPEAFCPNPRVVKGGVIQNMSFISSPATGARNNGLIESGAFRVYTARKSTNLQSRFRDVVSPGISNANNSSCSGSAFSLMEASV